MHEDAEQYMRYLILDGLIKLPESNQIMFKRMYAEGDLSKSIEEVVNSMPKEKLDRAWDQVKLTISRQIKK